MTRGRDTARELINAATPFVVGAVLFVIALWGAHRTFPYTWFCEAYPGANPPWYFIGRDVVDGAWAAAGFLALCLFTGFSARVFGPTVWAALGVNAVSFIGHLGPAVNAWLHTSHLRSRANASSRWVTFDSYMASRTVADDVSLGVGVAVAACALFWYWRALKKQRTEQDAPAVEQRAEPGDRRMA